MKVIANKLLYGPYGQVVQDQEFECEDERAQQLLKSGYVRHANPPKVQYETKVVTPEAPEVSAREQDETVDAEGNKVVSNSNISERPRSKRVKIETNTIT